MDSLYISTFILDDRFLIIPSYSLPIENYETSIFFFSLNTLLNQSKHIFPNFILWYLSKRLIPNHINIPLNVLKTSGGTRG